MLALLRCGEHILTGPIPDPGRHVVLRFTKFLRLPRVLERVQELQHSTQHALILELIKARLWQTKEIACSFMALMRCFIAPCLSPHPPS